MFDQANSNLCGHYFTFSLKICLLFDSTFAFSFNQLPTISSLYNILLLLSFLLSDFPLQQVAGTLVSRFMNLSIDYNIKTIGEIPTGFPSSDLFFFSSNYLIWQFNYFLNNVILFQFLAFEVPDLGLSKQLFMDGFIVSMVSYTVSVSMALIFAQKLNYEIDFNQELLAMGASNVCGSFFSCLPLSASLSRSAIQV